MVDLIQPIVVVFFSALYIVIFNAVALTIFISSVDDFILDCMYLARRVYRHLFIRPKFAKSSDTSLARLRKKQRALAICIPAWHEDAVIADMLTRAVRDLRYDNYKLFVGTYDNDLATRRAVERLRASEPGCAHRIRLVRHNANGPTNKADCLNSIYNHILFEDDWARKEGIAGFILHDAEDIIHPSELVVFNHLIDRADVIQLPVVPLARPLYDLIGGHYQDEFAESHTKDMVVREALGCGIPSAGVGCAFSADALAGLALLRGGKPFDARSVTEDYDVALDLCDMGYRGIFVRLPSLAGKRSFVATQEYFPNRFQAAVRQKSRWLLGIALESWTKRGWPGSWAQRYMLWRDRKSLITALASAAAYILLGIFLLGLLRPGASWDSQLESILPQGGIVYWIVLANFGFLVHRAIQRFAYVFRAYGLAQALATPFRIIVGNIINFVAAWRAAWLFRAAQLSGEASAWGKTDHQIPNPDAVITQPGVR